jgi:hypothetical protein
MAGTIYIKDLIKIPEHVGKGDFVLRLAEGVTDPEGTVKHYQVTPQLVKCFGQALKLVKSAIEGSTSKAAYLHGSFGSGKSHFMAILHLLLHSHARSIPKLDYLRSAYGAICCHKFKPQDMTDDILLALILGPKLLGPNASLSVGPRLINLP